jgi:large subunit ribosomal protein L22
MDIRATTKYIRLSPTKGRDLAREISGMPVGDALSLMGFNTRKAAFHLAKTLKSAIANAEHNAELSVDSLWIKEAVVEEAPRMKRFWPSARGGASPIAKRMCHMKIVLTDEAIKRRKRR